jgi:hypothetical protein
MSIDEYYGYLPAVFKLLKSEADAKSIAEYLVKIETRTMGLNGKPDWALQIAKILVDWKETVKEKYSRSP